MTPEGWAQITDIFGAALEKAASERAAYLAEACGGDESLRREVESLLAAEQMPSLRSPAIKVLGTESSETGAKLSAGQVLGRYRVEAKLGEGGMGAVYKAHDTVLRRPVAVKVLPGWCFADPESRPRLMREARSASALNHPNIVTVYDIGQADGIDFIAMEYVDGKTLDHVIPRKGLGLGETLKYAVQIADALACAHSAGIVHRDLKPSNVMVDAHGNVKVLDFGLAKFAEQGSSEENSTATAMVRSAEGAIVGTAAYMSPEQAEGKAVDARSDIFSFGSVLYEMVSGRRAFSGDTPVATLSAILQATPKAVEGLPAGLDKLIARCLRKNPAHRFQHMADVRLALEDLKDESDSGKLTLRPTCPSRRNARVALSVGAVLLLTGAWIVHRGSRDAEGPSALVPFTTYPGTELQPSFSPDGNQVAFVWDGEQQDNADIYVKLIGSETPLRLTTDPADDIGPAFSPDGRFIAFVRNRKGSQPKAAVYVVPAIGGPEKLAVETSAFGGGTISAEYRYIPVAPHPFIAWAQGGNSLIFMDRTAPGQPIELFLASLDSGERRKLTSAPAGSLGDGAPAVSPDGRTLLFSRTLSGNSCDLYRLALTNDFRPAGPPERLRAPKEWIATPVWIPAANDILFSAGRTFNGSFRLWRMPVGTGAEARALTAYGEAGWPAYSPARRRLVFSRSNTDSNIWRVPLPGPRQDRPLTKLIASTRGDLAPQYSADGSKIVFISERTGQPEVWVATSEGAGPVQLTSLRAGMTGSPHWSPDGKQIVFDSNIDGQFEIYTINAAGGPPRRLTAHPADDATPSYSHDGLFIYFLSNRTGARQIWKMPAEGGEAVQITRDGGETPLESHDGKFLFYVRRQPLSLWKCSVNGGLETQVSPLVNAFSFTVTRNGVYFIPGSGSDPTVTVQFLAFTASSAKPVYAINHPVGAGLAVSPDGKFLLYVQIDQKGSDLMLAEDFR